MFGLLNNAAENINVLLHRSPSAAPLWRGVEELQLHVSLTTHLYAANAKTLKDTKNPLVRIVIAGWHQVSPFSVQHGATTRSLQWSRRQISIFGNDRLRMKKDDHSHTRTSTYVINQTRVRITAAGDAVPHWGRVQAQVVHSGNLSGYRAERKRCFQSQKWLRSDCWRQPRRWKRWGNLKTAAD